MRYYLLLLLPALLTLCKPSQRYSAPLSYDPPGSTNTASKEIQRQEKRTWSIDGITVSNEFDGARVLDFKKVNDSIYQVVNKPENTPINMSPWYAFNIKSETEREVYIHLNYKYGKHRYYPDISRDGIIWLPLDSSRYMQAADSSVLLKLNLSSKPHWIAAQELMTSEDNTDWINSLVNYQYVQTEEFGKSVDGRKLLALRIGVDKKQPTLIVLSRQHPPEVTGYLAMQEFVEVLAGYSDLARQFREQFSVIVVPMMNPDGVDMGHWRHNAAGVDLNRDWQYYNQPEINAFQNYIKRLAKGYKLDIVLGIDFHSTDIDLIYTFDEKTYKRKKGVVKDWVELLQQSFPDEKIIEEDGDASSPVSKNWFLHEFNAEGVTYEVGDDTPRDLIKSKGEKSAQILMELLLERYGKQ